MANISVNGNITALSASIGGKAVVTSITNYTKGIKLSNGLIINWGAVTPSSGGTSVSFAVPFSTTNYCVGGSNTSLDSKQIRQLAVTSFGTSSMTCKGQWGENNAGNSNGDITFRWIAVGK